MKNEAVVKKEREHKSKSYHERGIEGIILKTELDSVREENQKLRMKIKRLKARITSAKIQCEAIDIVNLATSPPIDEGLKEIEFFKKLKADNKIFKKMVGMTLSDFNELLQDISGALFQLICPKPTSLKAATN
jgi:hypothetical protein